VLSWENPDVKQDQGKRNNKTKKNQGSQPIEVQAGSDVNIQTH
jgi:hypothetical protein